MLIDAGAALGEECKDMEAALFRGDGKILSILLRAGAPCDKADHFGRTLGMHAAECGFLECLIALKNAGADFAIQSDSGLTALDYANNNKRGHCLPFLESCSLQNELSAELPVSIHAGPNRARL